MNRVETLAGSSAVDRFTLLWQTPQTPPDVREFLDGYTGLSPREIADVLLVDQSCRWQVGCAFPVEQYLQAWPEVAAETELKLDLVYGEYRARSAGGESLDPSSVSSRFPELRDAVVRQIEVGRWLADAVDRPEQAAWPTRAVAEATAAARPASIPAAIDPQAPLVFSDFELQQRPGGGGMGEVLRAIQKSPGKSVAVKTLKNMGDSSREAIARFLREARAVAQVRHSGIVDVHGVGRCPDGGYFLVMDLVEGTSLQERLGQGVLPVEEAVRIVMAVADAVQHIHEHGIIHRDLKPSNVLLTPSGRPILTDFGLARHFQSEDADLSVAGQIIGTPQYMAPEQASPQRGRVGPATDVYGLGAILYALLTSRPPVQAAGTVEALAWFFSAEPPRPPHEFSPDVPATLEAVCLRCLRKDPAERFATAAEVAEALREAIGWEDAVPVSPPADKQAAVARSTGNQTAALALTLATVVGFAWWAFYVSEPGPEPSPTRGGAPVTAANGGSATQADVDWMVDVYRDGRRDRHLRLLDQPGPLFSGDTIRLRLAFTQPAYAYLFWIGSDETIELLYPAQPSPHPPQSEITVPAEEDFGFPVLGPAGTEVCVLLLRDTPPAEPAALIGRIRPSQPLPSMKEDAVVLNGQLLTRPVDDGSPVAQALSRLDPDIGSRRLAAPEPLTGPPLVDALSRWRRSLPPDLGRIHYLAIPHRVGD